MTFIAQPLVNHFAALGQLGIYALPGRFEFTSRKIIRQISHVLVAETLGNLVHNGFGLAGFMELQGDAVTQTKYIHGVQKTLIRESGNDRHIRCFAIAIFTVTIFTVSNKLYEVGRRRWDGDKEQ